MQVDYSGLLPSWKWPCFVLTGIDTFSGYGFTFYACNASVSTIIHKLPKYLIHHHDILHHLFHPKFFKMY